MRTLQVDRLAAGLVSIGIKRGDRVGMWGPNSVEWLMTMFAVGRIGAILVSLNPAYQRNEIRYALNEVKPRFAKHYLHRLFAS